MAQAELNFNECGTMSCVEGINYLCFILPMYGNVASPEELQHSTQNVLWGKEGGEEGVGGEEENAEWWAQVCHPSLTDYIKHINLWEKRRNANIHGVKMC